MSEEIFSDGVRVVKKGTKITGTSCGPSQVQFGPVTRISVELDNGKRETVPEDFLRLATPEDEEIYQEIRRRAEESDRYQRERRERIRKRREESEAKAKARRLAKIEEEEEAKRKKQIDHTAEMREENARKFGLESLGR